MWFHTKMLNLLLAFRITQKGCNKLSQILTVKRVNVYNKSCTTGKSLTKVCHGEKKPQLNSAAELVALSAEERRATTDIAASV